MTRISIDPVTRIEGHLRIDCDVDGNEVTRAWSSGQMWRGIELILAGRDPRDAWLIAQRICGVCTTVHAIVSVRAVEDALRLAVPLNAQYIRNLMIAAHGVHDHIVHFYQLAALDWVDIVSALDGDPAAAAELGASLSDYPHNSAAAIRAVKQRLGQFVASGQLGVFASGYWGHPAMRLPSHVNLLAATHYLQALDYQRAANRIVTILGGKTPHIQNLAVGGVANPINPDSQSTLTLERLYAIKAEIDRLGEFVEGALLTDAAAIGALYADWTNYGAGVTNYLSVPDLPLDAGGERFELPGGYIHAGDLASFRAFDGHGDEHLRGGVRESVRHAWYRYDDSDAARHPWEGQTEPDYTDFQDDGKYSWVKAPSFHGARAQVGPLANVLAMYAAGHEPTRRHLGRVLTIAGKLSGGEIPLTALHSTIGRIAARAVRCAVLLESLRNQWQRLMDNVASGDYATCNRVEFPRGEVRGVGFHEAPRGVLSHWVVIEDGKIRNYQAVVPSTWNAGPRDDEDAPGPYEAALLGNPIADPQHPLEVLRTIHSFDPCLACAIHVTDVQTRSDVRVVAT